MKEKALLVLMIVEMFVMPSSLAINMEENYNVKDIFFACIEKGILPDIEEIYKNKQNIDSDEDGLTDVYELKIGTSPFNPDCDGDGIPDGKDKTPIKVINLGLYKEVEASKVFTIDATSIYPNAFKYYWDLDYKCEGYEDMGSNLSHWFIEEGKHEIKLVAVDKDLTPTIYLLTIYVKQSRSVVNTETDWDPLVDIKVTVNIKRLKCYDSVDWWSAADMYVKVYIYDTWKKSPVFHKNDNDVSPDWKCTVNVPDDEETIPIKIQVWDDDWIWDDKLDIDYTSKKERTLEITYSVRTGEWDGEDYMGENPDNMGKATGYGFSRETRTGVDAGVWFQCYYNDYDSDGLTYWQETNVYYTSPHTTNKKQATVVGIEDYLYFSDLHYCVEDANDCTNYLRSEGYVVKHRLLNSAATEQQIKDCIWDIIRFADNTWRIAFTFAGHGHKYSEVGLSGTGSVISCYDGSPTSGTQGNLQDTELKDLFTGYTGKLFIFLDACRSGGMNEVVTQSENKENRYMVTACTANGESFGYGGYQNGVWTYWFIQRGLYNGQSGHQDMEGNFRWARQKQINWLKDHGEDDPDNYAQQFDGDPNSLFYL